MSSYPEGPGWWVAADGKWLPPEQAPTGQARSLTSHQARQLFVLGDQAPDVMAAMQQPSAGPQPAVSPEPSSPPGPTTPPLGLPAVGSDQQAGMGSRTILKVVGIVMIVAGLAGPKVIGYGETIYGPGYTTTEIWWGHIAAYIALVGIGAFLMWMSEQA